MNIEAYKNFIKEMDLGRWMQVISDAAILPTPETTLAQLKEQENAFRPLIIEVKNIMEQLQGFSRYQDLSLKNPKRESIIKHRHMVEGYLEKVQQGLAELRGLYSSQSKMNMIEPTKNKIISKLSTLLQTIDETMKQLD